MSAQDPTAQPTIDSLMLRFLANRSDAANAVETGESEVEPHEIAAGFRVNSHAAWLDATAPFGIAVAAPPEWTAFISMPAAAFAQSMAAGHFPQRVKDLQPLLAKFNPKELCPTGTQPPLPAFSGMRGWVAKNGSANPQVAAGISRMLGDFDIAESLLRNTSDAENERAALLWQRGKCAEALAAWDALPDSPAVLFNRGMARLFMGRIAESRDALQQAIDSIPETSGWHALRGCISPSPRFTANPCPRPSSPVA